MDRLIQKDGSIKHFDSSVWVHHSYPCIENIYEKPLKITKYNNQINITIKRHKHSFSLSPQFKRKTSKSSYVLPLVEFVICSIPIDYDFFIKKLSRNVSRIDAEILDKRPHWEYFGISTVLRKVSLEIINHLIDYYRIFSFKIAILPITENSLLYASYQIKDDNGSITTIEDHLLGPRKFDAIENKSNKFVDNFQYFLNKSNKFTKLELKFINSIRFLENGHFTECIATLIDSFHNYLDYLILKSLKCKSLLKKFKDSPEGFYSPDKVTWLFELISGDTLQEFLRSIGNKKLYEDYKKYKKIRNDIIHPKQKNKVKVSFTDAYKACKSILMIIRFIRRRIEKVTNENDILARLDTYVFSLTEKT